MQLFKKAYKIKGTQIIVLQEHQMIIQLFTQDTNDSHTFQFIQNVDFPILSLVILGNLIWYSRTNRTYKNHRFASNNYYYSCSSKVYVTFASAIRQMILMFQHLFEVLSYWKSLFQFLLNVISIYNFPRKMLYKVCVLILILIISGKSFLTKFARKDERSCASSCETQELVYHADLLKSEMALLKFVLGKA